jgi:8-oxo-dGTP pyrophosphatase MutT (NUDIX family)
MLMTYLSTAGLVVIRDRKLLLAFSNNKQAWYLPGGKTNDGETTLSALIREIKEEMNIPLEADDLRYYAHITAPAFGEEPVVMMEQDCYIHELLSTPVPSAEIGKLDYFNSRQYQAEKQVPGVILLMRKLKADGLID